MSEKDNENLGLSEDDAFLTEDEEMIGEDEDTENLPDSGFDIVTIPDPRQLKGMYRNWFLEYSSYVILERAVPHIDDGLKPVQRRILHSMKVLDDGRFNKVANIVGNTMQYHPHGDSSIKDALVNLGQKNLLVETQGNWGNVLTGAPAAAGRYIEARLSPFALDTLFNPKVTEWKLSYDGRKKEPVSLPSKFPLLLAQGANGIAVSLASKILPHNFNEIIDAAVAYLEDRPFELYPDFETGGLADVSKYRDGRRGGTVKIRAKIEKVDSKTLVITEIPYGKTTPLIIDSILKAFEKGKIKIRKVDDNTAENAAIMVYLLPGTSSDKAIDALYAFTDCEVSLSPNCCVISDKKPCFVGVSDVLRHNVDTTVKILRTELEIEHNELSEKLFFATLEKIFIENGIYKDKEYENAPHIDAAVDHIDSRLKPLAENFMRGILREDILKLVEIKMKRIFKFNADDADAEIARLKGRLAEVEAHLADIRGFTIDWFQKLKAKYGDAYPRRTVLRNFDSIEATRVAEANEKLYINREDGFVGTALKSGDNKDEFICNCSSLDSAIVFYKDGRYKVFKVGEKINVGKNVLYVNVFKPKDERTIYNVIYRNGNLGPYYMKRFSVTGVTRDKEYNLTPGKPGTKIMWFSANPNGEAEIVRVVLKPKLRLKSLQFEVDFSKLAVKGKQSQGNLVTKNEVQRIVLKERGASTLGGREVWFDPDILRLNYEGRGRLLGEFAGEDAILVVLKSGMYYTTNYSVTNHFEEDILRIEKFVPDKVFTAIVQDASQGFPYLKRFVFEPSAKKQSFIGENPDSVLLWLTSAVNPAFTVTFSPPEDYRQPLEVNAKDFVGVKSLRARGKRLTSYPLGEIFESEEETTDGNSDNSLQTDYSTREEPEDSSFVGDGEEDPQDETPGLFDLGDES